MIDLLELQYFLQLSVSLEKVIALFIGLGSRKAGLSRKIVIQSYFAHTPTTNTNHRKRNQNTTATYEMTHRIRHTEQEGGNSIQSIKTTKDVALTERLP